MTVNTDRSETRPTEAMRRSLTRRRRAQAAVVAAMSAGVLARPSSASAQIDDTAPSNDGLPGAALASQLIGWALWGALATCVIVMLYGAATWRGMGGNSGRGVEGKMYVAAGAIGALVSGLAIPAVNTLFNAGSAGA